MRRRTRLQLEAVLQSEDISAELRQAIERELAGADARRDTIPASEWTKTSNLRH